MSRYGFHIGEAERHQDRARAKLAALQREVAVSRAVGHEMREAVAGIAELKAVLAAAEERLDRVRELLS